MQRTFSSARSIQSASIGRAQDRRMQSETCHHEYRTWAELAAAAKTDTRAWLYLLENAPWAVKLLEAAPTRPH
jgi:hypothetical protein